MTQGQVVMRFTLIAALAGLLLSHHSLAVADEAAVSVEATPVDLQTQSRWSLRLPPDAPVTYHGVASFDEAGMGTAGMLYPAPGVAGLLVGIFAHGVVMDVAKQKQKDRMQATADQVLEPYKPCLDKFTYRELLQKAIGRAKVGGEARLIEVDADAGGSTLVESVPVFRLTQDQKAIIVDNLVAIQLPGVGSDAAYRTSIRVISSPGQSTDPQAFWLANDGQRIKDESARLLAESFDIAFNEVAKVPATGSAPYRTVRYLEGTVEKIERAQVLAEQCERLLIRTLRGNLMSVPVARSAVDATVDSRCITEVGSR
ncbi:MAG: hypothetical protein HZA64_01185 [Rhodocyclales bacterium]|nr:hypothetical protein [Rhodocyclales bacterium]MBI5784046.1 hypothetical protein [Rhodocyclales bacterium]